MLSKVVWIRFLTLLDTIEDSWDTIELLCCLEISKKIEFASPVESDIACLDLKVFTDNCIDSLKSSYNLNSNSTFLSGLILLFLIAILGMLLLICAISLTDCCC